MSNDPEYRRVLAEMQRLAEGEPDRASAEGARLAELAELAAAYDTEDADSLLEEAARG